MAKAKSKSPKSKPAAPIARSRTPATVTDQKIPIEVGAQSPSSKGPVEVGIR
jgi:hypothetical protein